MLKPFDQIQLEYHDETMRETIEDISSMEIIGGFLCVTHKNGDEQLVNLGNPRLRTIYVFREQPEEEV